MSHKQLISLNLFLGQALMPQHRRGKGEWFKASVQDAERANGKALWEVGTIPGTSVSGPPDDISRRYDEILNVIRCLVEEGGFQPPIRVIPV